MRADDHASSFPTSIKDEETSSDDAGFASLTDLQHAWAGLVARQAERQKQPPVGIDGVRAATFAARLDWNLAELHRVLNRRDEAGRLTYRFAPWIVRQVTPGGRSVYVPRLRDQVVLRLMAERISTAMASQGIPRGPPSQVRCARFLRRALRRDGMWFFRADIERFYERAPRGAALEALAAVGASADLIQLVVQMFSAPARPPFARRGEEVTVTGYPVGLAVSSLLGELLLSRVDAALSAMGVAHVRYVDDIAILAESRDQAAAAERELAAQVAALGLALSASKTSGGPLADGLTFLGLHADRQGVRLSPARVDRWLAVRQREVRELVIRVAALGRDEGREALASLIKDWNGELSGARGRLVPVAGAADDRDALVRVDRAVRQMLAAVMRRLDVEPAGRFRLVRAEVWGHRWRCSPRQAREQAERVGELG